MKNPFDKKREEKGRNVSQNPKKMDGPVTYIDPQLADPGAGGQAGAGVEPSAPKLNKYILEPEGIMKTVGKEKKKSKD